MLRAFAFPLLAALIAAQAHAAPHPSLPSAAIPDSLGVNIHFTDPRPGELEMLTAAGFRWVRMDFGWSGTERKRGEYDFSAYDRLSAALQQHQLRAIFILDYGNPLYDGGLSPHTEEGRAAFAKWAVAAVKHFAGRGYLWEMWNEPNGGFWKPRADVTQYAALARATGEALHDAGLLGPKGEAYIGPATSTIDLTFLEACFKAGLLEFWDAVSVHPYRQGTPESVLDEYHALRRLIAKYAPKGKEIPIISGEWGYSSAWQKFDEEKQAKFLPREFLSNLAAGVVLSIWYDWHDDGTDPKEPEHHFGLVHHEYHAGRTPVYDPKPAYLAMQAFASPAVASLVKMGAFATFGEGVGGEHKLRGAVPIAAWLSPLPRVTADGDAKVKSEQSVAPASAGDPKSPAGGEVLKLTYAMETGWKYLEVVRHEPIPPLPQPGADAERLQPKALGLWVHGDGNGCTARLRFSDSTGQTFQPDGARIDWKGWRYLTFSLEATEGKTLAHWGGANDGTIHYPIHWNSLFLLDGNRAQVKGEIFLAAPLLLY